MSDVIISKLSEPSNFGDDLVQIIKTRIERLEKLRDSRPAPYREYYDARIQANQRKLARIRCTQPLWEHQCS